MAVYGPLGDEQPRADLLVGQALGDQPRDVSLPLAEWPGRDRARAGCAGLAAWAAAGWPRARLSAASRPRCLPASDSAANLAGPSAAAADSVARASAGARNGMTLAPAPVRSASAARDQPGREPRLARFGGVAAQRGEQVELRHPVIDLAGDPQRLGE